MSKFRPSPAMAVAVFALFVALGGVSVAATAYLPRNSVGTEQIKNDSVTRAKIAHQSITSVLIKPGSLTASTFAAGQLPAGPKGDTGAAGPKGATGPAGSLGQLMVETRSVWIPAGHGETVTLTHAGKQAIAAGTSWKPDQDGLLATVAIRPVIGDSGQPIGYEARGFNATQTGHWFVLHVSFG